MVFAKRFTSVLLAMWHDA